MPAHAIAAVVYKPTDNIEALLARAARALGGFAEDARVIESTKAHLFLATELAAKVEKQGRELKAMRALLRDKLDASQMDLLGVNAPEGDACQEQAGA